MYSGQRVLANKLKKSCRKFLNIHVPTVTAVEEGFGCMAMFSKVQCLGHCGEIMGLVHRGIGYSQGTRLAMGYSQLATGYI